ncbi:hypothetical protein HO173_006981 [Letharia columbiana]|uniref:Uncharacterized protein n=1 Tax=Letharia columbiana TaxID=112416 RepID=A0A8H6L440_9LECA|nr:uncharacterized protein HO173_006981 [Letharia columbiana]KAF6234761.1 hypothetical protein HO173_006981 [Letharia columbiana]
MSFISIYISTIMITRILARCSRTLISAPTRSNATPIHLCRQPRVLPSITQPHLRRTFAAKTSADEQVEELQELYATAKDEFEIASEETEKKTVYAADDRAAAQEELAKFKEAYEKAINSADGEQIKNRIGSRVRELERAVEAMEEMAMED